MIKVVMERHCKPDKGEELKKLPEELRSKALQRDGSYSFETLRSTDDPSVWLSIAGWTFLEEWKAWQNSPERQGIISKIEPLLLEPTRESVFEIAR
ncbi:MAG: antibiotic biosynthesis monooxygenase [Chloroflexota bacterium]